AIGLSTIDTAQPMAFIAVPAVDVSRTGVKCALGRIVNNGVNMAGDHWIARIAQIRVRRPTLFLKMGILTERVSDFDRLAAVSRIIDVYGYRTAEDVAIVAPDQHFSASDVPGMDPIERMEVPAGLVRIFGGVWQRLRA